MATDTPAATTIVDPNAAPAAQPDALAVTPKTDGQGNPAGASATSTEAKAGERPEWMDQFDPDKKFASYDDFKAEYDRLTGKPETDAEREAREATEAAAPKDAPTEDARPKSLAEAKPEAIQAVKDSLAKSGGLFADPRYEGAALEFEILGKISDETMKTTAEAFGVPVEAVQQFVDGQVAARELAASKSSPTSPEMVKLATAILQVVPNEADYRAFMEWGAKGLTEAQRTAYDRALEANDADTTSALLDAYYSKYKASGSGPGPRDVTQEGGTVEGAGTGAASAYASQAAMQRDIAKPEYRTDPAFREMVKRRAAVSNW